MKEFEDIFFQSEDGLSLHARRYGQMDEGRVPIICLPGLTRNAADFQRFALAIRADADSSRPLVAFSYRGRGLSEWDGTWQRYTIAVELTDLIRCLDLLEIGKAFVVGTSRGGLIAHFLHQVRPELIQATVLNDVGPVVEKEGLNLIRGYLPEVRTSYATLEVAADAQRRIHGEAFPALNSGDWIAMARALFQEENGRYFSAFDPHLAKILPPNLDDSPLPSLWEQFHALARRPVLVIRGANSRLLSSDTMEQMVGSSSNVSAVTVEGQGHAPFLETGDLPFRIGRFFNQA